MIWGAVSVGLFTFLVVFALLETLAASRSGGRGRQGKDRGF